MTADYWKQRLEEEVPYAFDPVGIAEIRQWIGSTTDAYAGAPCAFMDATTLARIVRLLSDSPDELDVFTLWDLSTFVTAVVLNERIFHIGTYGLDSLALNEGLGNEPVVIEIPNPRGDERVRYTLLPIWYSTKKYLRTLQERGEKDATWSAMQSCWAELLGRQPQPFQLYNHGILHGYFTSEKWVLEQLQQEFHPANEDTALLMNFMPQQYVHEYTVLNTARGVYNLALCEAIDLPYYPSASRLPIIRSVINNGARVSVQAAAVLQDAFKATVRTWPSMPNTEFPLFLSSLLSRVERRSDILPVLAALRREAAPLRARYAEIENAARLGNQKEVEALQKALADDGQALALKWLVPVAAAAVLAILPKIGTLSINEAIVIAALAGLMKFKSQAVDAVRDSLFRPHLSFLSEVGNEARSCLQLLGESEAALAALR